MLPLEPQAPGLNYLRLLCNLPEYLMCAILCSIGPSWRFPSGDGAFRPLLMEVNQAVCHVFPRISNLQTLPPFRWT